MKLKAVRNKKIVLIIFLSSLSAVFLGYYVSTYTTSTRSKAAEENVIQPQGVSSESQVEKGDVEHISLYKKEGFLYKTDDKNDAAAQELIVENPKYAEEQKPKGFFTQFFNPQPAPVQLLPDKLLENADLVRSKDDEKDPYLKSRGFRLNMDHYYYNQTVEDIPVFGGVLAIHVKNDNEIYGIDGDLIRNTRLQNESVSEDKAKESALKEAQKEIQEGTFEVLETKKYILNKALLGLTNDQKNYLTLAVTVGLKNSSQKPFKKQYFIDLSTGNSVFSQSLILEALYRVVRDLRSCSDPYDEYSCLIRREEGSSPSLDYDSNQIYDNSGLIYNFYKNTYGRDSYNNAGATINGFGHLDEQNAYWDGTGGLWFGPGWATKDILGHEFTHAVTQYTADLNYSNQSGALNESMSDIFGFAIDQGNWTIGEGISEEREALRDFSNPPLYWQPDRLFSSYYYCGSGDSGGVHYNSGVLNKTFYLMVAGGNFNGCSITGVGVINSHAIMYRALTTYLTPSSNFKSMYTSINQSCNDLFGSTSTTCINVKKAAEATELDQQPSTQQAGAICTGVQHKTPACDINSTPVPTSIPTATPLPTSTPTPTPIIPTPTPGPPSANGKIAATSYQNSTSNVYMINPDTTEIRKIITNAAAATITISRDGTTIAYITTAFYPARIMITDRFGQSPQTLSLPSQFYPTNIVFSPDGNSLYFSENGQQRFRIYKVNKDGTNLTLLIDEPKLSGYFKLGDISNDGTKLVYIYPVNGTNEIFVANSDGTNRQNISNNPTVTEWDPIFSPDNTSVVFVTNKDFYKINIATQVKTLIVSFPDIVPYYPSFSPNGAQIVFSGSGSTTNYYWILFTINADGSNIRQVTPNGFGYYLSSRNWAVDPDYTVPTPIPTNTPIPPTPTPIPADINRDGTINILDFNIWRCEFVGNGICANPPSNKNADINNDGVIDIIDFSIWRIAFVP